MSRRNSKGTKIAGEESEKDNFPRIKRKEKTNTDCECRGISAPRERKCVYSGENEVTRRVRNHGMIISRGRTGGH